MTVSVLEAAKYACRKSEWQLSNLQLQKILYLAHMFHLGHEGSPLIAEGFEAWDYGPVQPELYHRAKVYGSSPVQNLFHSVPSIHDGTEKNSLDMAVDALAGKSAGWLVAVTHWEKGAWAKNYDSCFRGSSISNADIAQEYLDRAAATSAKAKAKAEVASPSTGALAAG